MQWEESSIKMSSESPSEHFEAEHINSKHTACANVNENFSNKIKLKAFSS